MRSTDDTCVSIVLTDRNSSFAASLYGYGYRYDKQRGRVHTELVTPVARTARHSPSELPALRDDAIAVEPESAAIGSNGGIGGRHALPPEPGVINSPIVEVMRTAALADAASDGEPLEFFRT